MSAGHYRHKTLVRNCSDKQLLIALTRVLEKQLNRVNEARIMRCYDRVNAGRKHFLVAASDLPSCERKDVLLAKRGGEPRKLMAGAADRSFG